MRIACVHQGYELYGSDRCFAESIEAIRKAYPTADIEVVLPQPGDIVSLLEGVASRIVFEPLWILRRRGFARLALTAPLLLPLAVARALRRFRSHDIVYINTSVVADYMIAARFFSRRALLHVHEIPEGPAMTVLRALVRWSGAEIVFNSGATRTAFALPPKMATQVIYNGIKGPACVEGSGYDGARRLRVLMLGRISRNKGQETLLDAVSALGNAHQARIEVRIVGSAFEDPEAERALRERAAAPSLAGAVTIEPFTTAPDALYRWADVVAVPSRFPEPLGRVAIEAMAYARPPIVSAIGGLVEIVRDGSTGWLVPPGDSASLAARLRHIIDHPQAWASFGAEARARYQEVFSAEAVAAAIVGVVARRLRQPPSDRPVLAASPHAT